MFTKLAVRCGALKYQRPNGLRGAQLRGPLEEEITVNKNIE